MKTTLTVVLLLTVSNAFMTLAWYGHLRFKQVALVTTILVSWLIASLEYCFQVPANRIGYGHFTATQLKVIQEVVSLSVFAVFVFLYLGERPTWRSGLAFLLIAGAVGLVSLDGPKEKANDGEQPEQVQKQKAE